MEGTNSNIARIIGLRLTPREYAKIEQKWKANNCRKLNNYVRRHLFNEPLITNYRNQSLDDLIEETAMLRKELNHIGNNFNQAVKPLHTLSQIAEFGDWLMKYELEKKVILNKVDEIK